ncbi:MAG: hypothetical protein HYU43_03925, partial [Armatimonadetes bacterium]|nr:hypothetical protein [Armatimonadota bacterium]
MATDKEQHSAEERSRIEAALRKLLESRTFSAAARLQDLMRYLVTETLAGRGDRLNQSSIAIDVQGKDASFDPATDSQVRVEAGRLRSKLREYYDEEGGADEVRFELPKGLYEPRIRFGAQAVGGDAPARPTPLPDSAFLPPHPPQLPDSAFLPPHLSREGDFAPPHLSGERAPAEEQIDESIFPTTWRARIIQATIVVLALTAVIFFVMQQKPETKETAAGPTAQTEEQPSLTPKFDGAKSLAVLPFANNSLAAENAGFFADGLHDDLLTQLTKIADLKVISRTSVMGYRDAPKPIRQIAQELGVRTVLEGAVQRAGDRIRVNVQLIDGRTDEHLWAETFDQVLNTTNVFEIQRQIATQIAAALQAKLSPEEQGRLAILPTRNIDAYELYLKAEQRLSRRTLDDMAAAADLFKEALNKDPQFALAYSGLAESAYLRNVYGGMDRKEMTAIARPALAQAFKLNDQIGEAWTVEGALRVLEENPAGAEQAFKRAIALNPNYAQAYHWYASLLHESSSRRDEAFRLTQRAKELDPLSPLLRANMAEALEGMGRMDEALVELKTAIEIDPNFEVAVNGLAYHYLFAQGDIPAAMQLLAPLTRDGKNFDALSGMALGYELLGEMRAADKWLQRFLAQVPEPSVREMGLAYFLYARGEDEQAVEHASEALKDKSKYSSQFRPLALAILRNRDLREGRIAVSKARYLAAYPGLS